ncbi:MAG: hypothetical protein CMI26_06520 [Opitutae bacterium]|jgi:CubicO group peptidase (beta-lactamase class C family)|nr:hypothetical protein [Opitutae bacterium]|tara:strand:+ start:399 stop:665 length:267 start_codon:yes stop_codon:yes gene_type:complete
MTSVLLASMVGAGEPTWDTSLIDVLPELKGNGHRDYHAITLWRLLTHRAGGEANAENFWVYLEMELKKCRLAILEANLKEPPVRKQGK